MAINGAPPPNIATLILCAIDTPEQRTVVGIISASVTGITPKNNPINIANMACTEAMIKQFSVCNIKNSGYENIMNPIHEKTKTGLQPI